MKTIYRLTLSEGLHRRIFLLILLMTFVFFAFYGFGLHLAFDEEDMNSYVYSANVSGVSFFFVIGLYFTSFILGILAILSSVGSIQGEIESGLMYGLLSKPLTRREILMGKFLGNATLYYLYALLLFLGVYALNRWLSAGSLLSFETTYFIAAAVVFSLQPLILLSLTLCLSTRLAPMSAGVVVIILYGIALVGGFVEQLGIDMDNLAVEQLGIFSSLLVPVDAMYRFTVGTLTNHLSIPLALPPVPLFGTVHPPSLTMVGYALLYIAAFLALAGISFHRRDV